MKLLVLFLIYVIGLLGTVVLVVGIPIYLVLSEMEHRHTGQRGLGFFVVVAMLCGFAGGGTLIWSLVPPEWNLSFLTTFDAATNAKKYGHPTEHYAEMILVWMMFGSVAGATLSGVLTATAGRLVKRRRARVA